MIPILTLTRILRQLEVDEYFVPTVYRDSRGYQTLGIGLCVDKRVRGAGITLEEARWLAQRRVEERVRRLQALIPFWLRLAPARQGALLNMSYQLGVEGLLHFQKMLAAMRDEHWPLAAQEALDSDYAKQTPNRARKYARQIETGEWQ